MASHADNLRCMAGSGLARGERGKREEMKPRGPHEKCSQADYTVDFGRAGAPPWLRLILAFESTRILLIMHHDVAGEPIAQHQHHRRIRDDFTVLNSFSEILHLLGKDAVLLRVLFKRLVPTFAEQLFFKGEMKLSISNHSVEDRFLNIMPASLPHSFLEFVKHGDQDLMLAVDSLDLYAILWLP